MSACLPPLTQLLHLFWTCCDDRSSPNDLQDDTQEPARPCPCSSTDTRTQRACTGAATVSDPPCNVTTRPNNTHSGITRKGHPINGRGAADTMHMAQQNHPFGFVSVGNGAVRGGTMQPTPPSTPVEDSISAVSRTVSLPDHFGNGKDSQSRFPQGDLLLAWALLLQRDQTDDHRVDHFTWGYRSAGGSETAQRFSLSAAGLELSRAKSDTVSSFLDVVRESTKSAGSSQAESLFFNDEPQALAPQKGGSDPTVSAPEATMTEHELTCTAMDIPTEGHKRE